MTIGETVLNVKDGTAGVILSVELGRNGHPWLYLVTCPYGIEYWHNSNVIALREQKQ